MNICRRNIDGAIFRSSYPRDWTDDEAWAGVFDKGAYYFFREIKWKPYTWWLWRMFGGGRWIDTGVIWEHDNASAFTILCRAGVKALKKV